MAAFKHISSKNAAYGAAEKYLTFAHDEFSMKPTLDENGRLVPRSPSESIGQRKKDKPSWMQKLPKRAENTLIPLPI